jgi:hypothetical protein
MSRALVENAAVFGVAPKLKEPMSVPVEGNEIRQVSPEPIPTEGAERNVARQPDRSIPRGKVE